MHGIVHKFYYRDMLREAIHTIHFDFRYESAAGAVLRWGRTNLTGRRSSGRRSLLAFDDMSTLLQERGPIGRLHRIPYSAKSVAQQIERWGV